MSGPIYYKLCVSCQVTNRTCSFLLYLDILVLFLFGSHYYNSELLQWPLFYSTYIYLSELVSCECTHSLWSNNTKKCAFKVLSNRNVQHNCRVTNLTWLHTPPRTEIRQASLLFFCTWNQMVEHTSSLSELLSLSTYFWWSKTSSVTGSFRPLKVCETGPSGNVRGANKKVHSLHLG